MLRPSTMTLPGLIFLALYFTAALAKVRLNYNDVQQPGMSCPQLDTCKKSNDRYSFGNQTTEWNCACDYLCSVYDDCCIDAPKADIKKEESMSQFTCYETKQHIGVFMIDTCLPSYEGPDDVRYECESGAREGSDPMGNMPITNIDSGITYKNYYCSICNYMTDNMVLWTPRLECPSLTFIEDNVTYEYAFSNLVSANDNWGIYLAGDNGSLFFHDCQVDPIMPKALENKIRLCVPGLISDCPPEWEDEEVRNICQAYMGVRYTEVPQKQKYRNGHCAKCNGADTEQLLCVSTRKDKELIFRGYDVNAFSLLLDVNERGGNEVGKFKQCDDGEIFDPFFKVCRSLACLPGYKKHNKKCVPRGLDDDSSEETKEDHDKNIENALKHLGVEDSIEEPHSGDGSIPVFFPEGPDHFGVNSNEDHLLSFPGSFGNHTVDNVNKSVHDLPKAGFETMMHKTIEKLQNCLLISLASEDYVMLPDKTIYVPKYNKTYEPTTYHSNDGLILVCSHLTDNATLKFMPLMGYVTTGGLIISMVCLFLHLCIFCLVPELQNLSGKNLASHCVTLLCAYGCFLIGSLSTLSFEVCSALSFFTVYFFQVSFFWMAIMAFDVWRTLKMATTELRVANGKQHGRFIFYSLFTWITPMVIIATAAFAEYTDFLPEDYRPGFAAPQCWFKRRRALLVYFVMPLIGIMAANVLLFFSSARMLVVATQTSLKQQHQNQKRSFKLYLRLALLMGLTWASGFVASYFDVEPLWYVFVILNTLQGLFIFVAFSCTTKVYNYLVKEYGWKKKSSSKSTNSSGSTNTSNLSSSRASFRQFFSRIKRSSSNTSSNSSIKKVKPLF